jgi:hypothetical protein
MIKYDKSVIWDFIDFLNEKDHISFSEKERLLKILDEYIKDEEE